MTNQRLTEEDALDTNPAMKGLSSIHTQLRPQTRVRTRTRMAEKDGRMRWRVQMHFQVFGIIQDQPFLPSPPPLSALALGPCVSQFQLAALAPGVLQLRGREGGRGPASSLPRAWRRACLCKFSPIHTVSAHSLRHQAYSLVIKLMVTILEGNPGHCRGKVIERKILGSGLRLGGLGETLRKLGHSRLDAVENGRGSFTNDCLSNSIY